MGTAADDAPGLGVAAVGVALLSSWDVIDPYGGLLPAMLAWGIGLGVLTPAVVAAALAAVPPQYAGLASGINSTARQAGGVAGGRPLRVGRRRTRRPGPVPRRAAPHRVGHGSLFLVAGVSTAIAVPTRS